MSNPQESHLPPEILDHIVDLLHDHPETLKECCLVSRSWIPRAQKLLFATVDFISEGHIKVWKKAFPDPIRSPACYTRNLVVHCAEAITAEDARVGCWLQTFSRVVRLELNTNPEGSGPTLCFFPFHRFSHSVKSLQVTGSFLLRPQTLRLIYSLHLLENLALNGKCVTDWGLPPPADPSTSPALTGTLELALDGIGTFARRLLELPNGLHFRKLVLTYSYNGDLPWIQKLVATCSGTLECLDVTRFSPGTILLRPRSEPVTYLCL